MSALPEGDNKPKYDPRFPAGLGSWRNWLSDKEISEDPGPTGKRIYASGVRRGFSLRELSGRTSKGWDDADEAEDQKPSAQTLEQGAGNREPRNINEVKPEEVDQYLAVPGWRIWIRHLSDNQEFCLNAQEAGAKELALTTHVHGKGYDPIYSKLEAIDRQLHPNRPRLPFGYKSSICTTYLPWYILEPLTADEVKTIDESGEVSGPVGSIDRAVELLRPEELRKILEEPDHPSEIRFRPIKFLPATI